MKTVSRISFIILFFSISLFSQDHPEFINNHEFEQIEQIPVFLEIDQLTNCPVEIISLNLGKIKVKEFTDGSTNETKKIPDSFSLKPTMIRAFFWDLVPVIKWFHRNKKQKIPERKTVSVVIGHPENNSQTKVKLWYAWPSEITIKQEGEFPAVYITFEADQVEMEYPDK